MRSKLRITLILTLSLVWLILPQAVCLGATYYVDADKGYDCNPGAIEQPFKTIQTGVDAATSGDTIIVYSGTYHEAVVINKENLTIMGEDPSNPPELDGADQNFNPTWEHVQGHIYKTPYTWYKNHLTDEQYCHYGGGKSESWEGGQPMQVYEDDTLLRGYSPRFNQSYEYVTAGPYKTLDKLDSASYSGPSPYPGTKHDISKVPGRFLYDGGAGELYVWSANEDDPANHDYYIPVIFRLITIKAPNTTIKNMVIKHSSAYAVELDGADGSTIEDNYFVNNMYPICVKNSGDVSIKGNFIQQKGFWERYWYWDVKGTKLWVHAIDIGTSNGYVPADTPNLEINNNMIYGYYSALLTRSYNTRIHDNIISHTMSTHINAYSGTYLYIYHNVFHHVDDNSMGLSHFDNGPAWIYRNLFYRCKALNKAGQDDTSMPGNVYLYHNTFALGYVIATHPYVYRVYKKHVYRNNIFYMKWLQTAEYYWSYTNKDPAKDWSFFPSINGPDSDYNLYWQVEPRSNVIAAFRRIGEPGTYYYPNTFDQMLSDTGLDPNGFKADPLFVNKTLFDELDIWNFKFDNFSDMDYRRVIAGGFGNLFDTQLNDLFNLFNLSENSPAVNRGESLPADWPDVVEVTDGQPDIGAHEYISTSVILWRCLR